VDANQGEIVCALEAAGASVQSLAALGSGVPDLLVCFRKVLYLIECKDGSKPPSKRALTTDQKLWIALWGGPVYVVDSPAGALRAIGATQ
jgi:hypothetical protein